MLDNTRVAASHVKLQSSDLGRFYGPCIYDVIGFLNENLASCESGVSDSVERWLQTTTQDEKDFCFKGLIRLEHVT